MKRGYSVDVDESCVAAVYERSREARNQGMSR
jgi:hypothetical protein